MTTIELAARKRKIEKEGKTVEKITVEECSGLKRRASGMPVALPPHLTYLSRQVEEVKRRVPLPPLHPFPIGQF